MAGYPLRISGLACVGALACGPQAEDPTGGSSGYGLTGTSDSATSQGTGVPTISATDNGSAEDTMEAPECQGRGEICGEMSVCQCDCDYDVYCCGCSAAECTDNSHCDAGQACVDVSDSTTWVALECIPGICTTGYLSYPFINSADEATSYEGDVCLGGLRVNAPDLVDLTAFASLEYLHTGLQVDDSPLLVTLDGLGALQQVSTIEIEFNETLTSIEALSMVGSVAGGSIRANPMLPTLQVETLLAGIEGGDLVEVCGNLDGDPCS